MKTIRRVSIWSASVLALVLIVLTIWPDDTLDPAVEAQLREPARLPPLSNGFNALIGFASAPDADLVQTGFDEVTRMNKVFSPSESKPEGSSHEAVSTMWKFAWDREPFAEALCSFAEPDCVSALRQRKAQVSALAREYQPYLDRYAQLATFSSFQTEQVAHIEAPLPSHAPLVDMAKLSLAIDTVASPAASTPGHPSRTLATGRALLAKADMLITKMIAVAVTTEAVHARFSTNLSAHRQAHPVKRLSLEELTLHKAAQYEFRFVATAASMVSHPTARREFGYPDWVPNWLYRASLRPLYKKNRSLNRAYRCFEAQLRPPTKLDLTRTADDQGAPPEACEPGPVDWLLNPIGTALFEVASIDLTRYRDRLGQLDGLTQLARLLEKSLVDADGDATLEATFKSLAPSYRHPLYGTVPTYDATRKLAAFPVPEGISERDRKRYFQLTWHEVQR